MRIDPATADDLVGDMAIFLAAGETVEGLATTRRLRPPLTHVVVTSARIAAFRTDLARAGFRMEVWLWDITSVEVRHALGRNAFFVVTRTNGAELDLGDMHPADAATIQQLGLRLKNSAIPAAVPSPPPPGNSPPNWPFLVSAPEPDQTRTRGRFGNKKLVERLETENADLRDRLGRLQGMDAIQLAAEQRRLRDEVTTLRGEQQEATANLMRLRADAPTDPRQTVLPHIAYRDVAAAADWLTAVFGFAEYQRYAAGAQMYLGEAWVVITATFAGQQTPAELGYGTQSLTVFVRDIDAHYKRAKSAGAVIAEDLHETIYGTRQFGVRDLDGHHWIFSTHPRPTE